MYYKHYAILLDEKNEYKETIMIAITTSITQAEKLDFILKTFYSINQIYSKYKIGFTQI